MQDKSEAAALMVLRGQCDKAGVVWDKDNNQTVSDPRLRDLAGTHGIVLPHAPAPTAGQLGGAASGARSKAQADAWRGRIWEQFVAVRRLPSLACKCEF